MDNGIKYALQSAVLHRSICKIKISTEPDARHVHPYGLCVSKDGIYQLICWQEDGHSSSGKLPSFRTIPLEEVVSLEITTEKFTENDTFNPAHKMYNQWEFHI